MPLTGEYGIYTMENGELAPYPSASEQFTVWANAAPDGQKGCQRETARHSGGHDVPICAELSGAAGFARDETTYEVTLTAGETRVLACAVSSDRGFLNLDVLDATTGGHVSGGRFELLDERRRSRVGFEMGEAAYPATMACACRCLYAASD